MSLRKTLRYLRRALRKPKFCTTPSNQFFFIIQVLIPAGIAAVIEFWKVTIAFKVRIDFGPTFFSIPKVRFDSDMSASEKETKEIDAVAMSYLAYLLYPLCLGGAVYSLVYTPHKSWYSWTIQSLVSRFLKLFFDPDFSPSLDINYLKKVFLCIISNEHVLDSTLRS